ncbi:hypothetical protein WA026_006133 [Henosepilachna vigintioctopunctata]|uniref:DUF4592 domain-containing protein n=1 Tax=Henosepilachna vigintioctopunctata TaxID=420089 RepID=A0AAW1TJZ6_9CUCU
MDRASSRQITKFRTSHTIRLIRSYVEKDLPNKSHSTCSDGSLLSVGSSDIEEDFFSQIKLSTRSTATENTQDLDLNASSLPLNHSAAHHRVAVRPKKTHGVPKRKRVQQLPTTIEVNEDSSIRSSSPEATTRVAPGADNKLNRSRSNAGSKSQDALEEHIEKEEKGDRSFFERLFPRRSAKKKKSKHDEKKQEEKRLKLEEQSTAKHEDKKVESRRKSEETKNVDVVKTNSDKYNNIRDETFTSTSYFKQTDSSYRRYETKPIPAVRSGAAYRQRVLPIDIPDSPETFRKDEEAVTTRSQLPDILSTSPLQLELENKLKQRLTRSSPPQNVEESDVPLQSSVMNTEQGDDPIILSPKSPTSHYFENKKLDDVKPKIKIAGLSSLQQKALSLNEDEEDYHNFKSLTEFPSSPPKSNALITKSHSFKTTKSTSIQSSSASVSTNKNIFSVASKDTSKKSTSLDNVKVFDATDRTTEKIQRTSVQTVSEKIEHQSHTKKQTIEIKCDVTVHENENFDEQISKCIKETKTSYSSYADKNHITISGPSHTAVVNVKNTEFYNITPEESQSKTEVIEKNSHKEHLISITKINVLPENKEIPPESPVLLETKSLIPSKSPKFPDQMRTRPVFNFDIDKQMNATRKFSRDDVEIVDKVESEEKSELSNTSPILTVSSSTTPTSTTGPLFKKNGKGVPKKSSLISITPDSPTKDKSITSCKSSSLDSLDSDPLDSTDKSSQDSLDKLTEKSVVNSKDRPESVVLRKKSSVKESREDEPELMKVFARRSLKLKDSENEVLGQQINVMMSENCDKARDSDKENQTDSPVKERKKSSFKENMISENITKKPETEQLRKKSTSKSDDEESNGLKKRPLTFELEKKEKEVLIESNVVHSKPIPIRRNSKSEINSLENTEVTIRKPIGDQNSAYQRSVSVNKSVDNSQNILRKQFISRRKTDNWITNMKNEEGDKGKEMNKEEGIVQQSESATPLIIEPKNFNQRKAEWERRAQDAQKKSSP